jgi:hypothetical protein
LMAIVLIFRPDGMMGGRELPFPFRRRNQAALTDVGDIKKDATVQ